MRELLSVRPSSSDTLVPRTENCQFSPTSADDAEVPGVVRAELLQSGLILRVIADVRVGHVSLDITPAEGEAIARREHVTQLRLTLELLAVGMRAQPLPVTILV